MHSISLGTLNQSLEFISKIKEDGNYHLIDNIFKYLEEREFNIAFKAAGSLTQDKIIEFNAKINVYRSLQNLHKLIRNEILNKKNH